MSQKNRWWWRRRHSSRRPGPAARWIAPSTPPPPSSDSFAALTIASTLRRVMSPSAISIRFVAFTFLPAVLMGDGGLEPLPYEVCPARSRRARRGSRPTETLRIAGNRDASHLSHPECRAVARNRAPSRVRIGLPAHPGPAGRIACRPGSGGDEPSPVSVRPPAACSPPGRIGPPPHGSDVTARFFQGTDMTG